MMLLWLLMACRPYYRGFPAVDDFRLGVLMLVLASSRNWFPSWNSLEVSIVIFSAMLQLTPTALLLKVAVFWQCFRRSSFDDAPVITTYSASMFWHSLGLRCGRVRLTRGQISWKWSRPQRAMLVFGYISAQTRYLQQRRLVMCWLDNPPSAGVYNGCSNLWNDCDVLPNPSSEGLLRQTPKSSL